MTIRTNVAAAESVQGFMQTGPSFRVLRHDKDAAIRKMRKGGTVRLGPSQRRGYLTRVLPVTNDRSASQIPSQQ
jgi:hypothetical protein